MARIRTVKPEIWTDSDFVCLSSLARLLFIGSWNYADDHGVLKDDPAQLKLQILPNDQCDPFELVDELVAGDFMLRRTAPDGTRVLVIRTFNVHQKIDKRTVGRWGEPDDFTDPPPPPTPTRSDPDPAPNDLSPPVPPSPAESPPSPPDPALGKEGRGRERKGREIEARSSFGSVRPLTLVPDDVSPPATSRSSPVQQVFDAWRASTGKTRAKLDAKRRRRIESALRDYPLEDVIDAVCGWRRSSFHRGQNDRSKPYNELDLLLRDASHIEQFRDLERSDPAVSAVRSEPRSHETIRAVLGGSA